MNNHHLDDLPSVKSDSNNNADDGDTFESTTQSSSSACRPMVVAINGDFQIQNEDDYIATSSTVESSTKNGDRDRNRQEPSMTSTIGRILSQLWTNDRISLILIQF